MAKPVPSVLSRLVEAIRVSGMSSRVLSERTGISHTQVSKVMRGEAVPSLANAEKLAQAVGGRLCFDDSRT